jgi:small-conductance mechanosensitive channel
MLLSHFLRASGAARATALGCVACGVLVLTLWASSGQANPNEGLGQAPPGFDRGSPRATLSAFLEAARAGDYRRAAFALDTRGLPAAERAAQAPEIARRLLVLIDRDLRLDPEQLSDSPQGDLGDGPLTDRIGEIARPGAAPVPLHLARVPAGSGAVWVFSRTTVLAIPEIYRGQGFGFLEPWLHPVLVKPVYFGAALWQWLGLVLVLPLAFLLSTLVLWVSSAVSRRTRVVWDDELFRRIRKPLRWLLVLLSLAAMTDALGFVAATAKTLSQSFVVCAVLCAGWLAYYLVEFAAWLIEERTRASLDSEADPFVLRNVQTQVRVLCRVLQVVLVVVFAAIALVQLESVRSLGVSLLASAGLVGVVLGLAAQKPVAALLAGIQVSLTRPVRIGDTVVFDQLLGTIEEIRLTHVVVKVWDDRRLVIPMSRLLEQPFENWTKVSSELLGTVFAYADYGLPMDAVRARVAELLRGTELWDGRKEALHVTQASERCIELRVLVSARDPSALWDLRCHLREHLVAWLATYEGGRFLPRLRADNPVPTEVRAQAALPLEPRRFGE